ncbi:hypothetical protein COBT_001655 [Conglomerata obtusa]
MALTNYEAEIKSKIEEATSLLTKKSFPLNFFHTYDPFRAGDLLMQIGDIYLAHNKHLKATQSYIQSAEAYTQSKDDIAKSYAAQSYNKAADVFSGKDLYTPQSAVDCYNSASDLYAIRGNFSLAASRKNHAADILIKELDYDQASIFLSESNELYEKAKMPANRNLILEKYFYCLIKCKKYGMAGDVALEMGSEKGRESFAYYFMMLACFCYFVEGRESEMKDVCEMIGQGEERNIVEGLMSENKSEVFDEMINKYARVSLVKEEIIDLIENVKKMTAPEFDIL